MTLISKCMHIRLLLVVHTTYKYKIRSTINNSIPEMAEKTLHMIEKNKAPDLHVACETQVTNCTYNYTFINKRI